jgi:hypothetical protein
LRVRSSQTGRCQKNHMRAGRRTQEENASSLSQKESLPIAPFCTHVCVTSVVAIMPRIATQPAGIRTETQPTASGLPTCFPHNLHSDCISLLRVRRRCWCRAYTKLSGQSIGDVRARCLRLKKLRHRGETIFSSVPHPCLYGGGETRTLVPSVLTAASTSISPVHFSRPACHRGKASGPLGHLVFPATAMITPQCR